MRSVKIPLGFLITGVLWALFSHPLISFFTKGFSPQVHDIARDLNHFVFVGFVSVILYFEIRKQHRRLILSEEQYRALFEHNPNPMWIFKVDTLRFVKVNMAAVTQYGYSEKEFLSLTVKDIRPESEMEKFLDRIQSIQPGLSQQGIWKHITKHGEVLYVSVVSYNLKFNGELCRLTMASNITDIILKEEKIKAQNAALHEIAWLNSHEVRRALCSVMSLTELVKDAVSESERREYVLLLQQCTNELDEVLKKTNNKVDELKES